MSLEENKNIVRQHMEGLDQRNLEGVLKYYAPEAHCHGLAPQTLDSGGYRQAMLALFAAFPDSRFSTQAIIAEGDKVAVQHSLKGTHLGEFQGIPPTGKPVNISAIAILQFADGKVIETWLNADFLGMLQQLGVAVDGGQ